MNIRNIIIIISILLITGCGSIKIGIDEETLDAIDSFVSEQIESEGSSDTSSTEVSEDDTVEIESKEYVPHAGANLLGTYTKLAVSANYYIGNKYLKCGYNFPTNIRVYSLGNELDFISPNDDLVWIADIFPDETFDFLVTFNNSVGQPTMQTNCTCTIEESGYKFKTESINCGCEESDKNSCKVIWEKK